MLEVVGGAGFVVCYEDGTGCVVKAGLVSRFCCNSVVRCAGCVVEFGVQMEQMCSVSR